MSVIDWKAIETAIVDWAAGKLPEIDERNQLVWADQNLAQAPYPYLLFKRDSVIRSGSQDEVRDSTDLTQPLGKEIALDTRGVREFTLTINAFVDEETGANDPNCDAVALLSTLQLSLSELSTQEIFCLAGLAVIEELAITDLSEVVNATFISRASMDVRLRSIFSSIERTGFIDTVEISSVPVIPSGPSDVTGVNLTVVGS